MRISKFNSSGLWTCSLPLKTDEQFTRLLAEYFSHTPILPQSLKWSLQKLPTTWIGAHVGALVLRRQFTRMAYTFIAGDSIHGAMPVLKHLWRSGRCASVDLLGETTVSEAEADGYRDRCLDALRGYHEQAQGWPGRPLLERDHLGLIPRRQPCRLKFPPCIHSWIRLIPKEVSRVWLHDFGLF